MILLSEQEEVNCFFMEISASSSWDACTDSKVNIRILTHFLTPDIYKYKKCINDPFIQLPPLLMKVAKHSFSIVNKCCPLLDHWQKYKTPSLNVLESLVNLGSERTLFKFYCLINGELHTWKTQLAWVCVGRKENNNLDENQRLEPMILPNSLD